MADIRLDDTVAGKARDGRRDRQQAQVALLQSIMIRARCKPVTRTRSLLVVREVDGGREGAGVPSAAAPSAHDRRRAGGGEKTPLTLHEVSAAMRSLAMQRLARAMQAAADRRWTRAMCMLRVVVDLEPHYEEARRELARVEALAALPAHVDTAGAAPAHGVETAA